METVFAYIIIGIIVGFLALMTLAGAMFLLFAVGALVYAPIVAVVQMLRKKENV